MGRGRSGRVSANASSSRRSATHPQVSDIDAYGVLNSGLRSEQSLHAGPDDRTSDESVQWFVDNMGMNPNDAYQAADVFLFYSRGGDGFMHNDTEEGNGKVNNDIIDKILKNPQSPVFVGEQFRGITLDNDKFNGDPRSYIQNIIDGGVWKENGATSFSATRSVAEGFGNWDSDWYRDKGISVMIHHSGGSGMPMKHLSSYPYEDEVIHSRAQMKNGMKIVRHEWSADGKRVEIWVEDNK